MGLVGWVGESRSESMTGSCDSTADVDRDGWWLDFAVSTDSRRRDVPEKRTDVSVHLTAMN